MEKFINNLTGGLELSAIAAGFIFALVGAVLSLRLHAKSRNKSSPETPYKFKFGFMLQDNLQRLFTGFLITLVAFRFSPQILNQEYSMFLAFLIGLLNDQVAGLIAKLEIKARK